MHVLDESRPDRSLGEQRRHGSRRPVSTCWKPRPRAGTACWPRTCRGPFFLTQAVASAMLELNPGGDRRRAANCVHHVGLQHFRQRRTAAEYCVAKAGLSMVAQLFAVRLAGRAVLPPSRGPGRCPRHTEHGGPLRWSYGRSIPFLGGSRGPGSPASSSRKVPLQARVTGLTGWVSRICSVAGRDTMPAAQSKRCAYPASRRSVPRGTAPTRTAEKSWRPGRSRSI